LFIVILGRSHVLGMSSTRIYPQFNLGQDLVFCLVVLAECRRQGVCGAKTAGDLRVAHRAYSRGLLFLKERREILSKFVSYSSVTPIY
jgi:hypothetical protein